MTSRLTGLEALRGLAAILVAVNHAAFLGGYPDALSLILRKSYLAVDLFFLLSGYVLARTYEHRMPAAPAFLFARFRRLWPPIAAGVAVCTLFYVAQGVGLATLVPYVVTGLAILPALAFVIPLNPPAWSIFFELVANFAHALVFRRFPTWALGSAVAACAVWLVAASDVHGLDVGQGERFWLGFPRVAMSYLLGVALWRTLGDKPRTSARTGWLAVFAYAPLIVLVPLVLAPVAEIVFVLFAGPLILLAVLSIGESRMARLAGAFSFPLYALHYPVQMIGEASGLHWSASLALSVLAAPAIGALIDSRWRAALLGMLPVRRAIAAA